MCFAPILLYSSRRVTIVFQYGHCWRKECQEGSRTLNRPAPWISLLTLLGISRSFAGLGPFSERLLQSTPQLICFPLREFSEMLFKFSLELVPGTFDLKLVHGDIDS